MRGDNWDGRIETDIYFLVYSNYLNEIRNDHVSVTNSNGAHMTRHWQKH